jgi:tripartite-type tricarboxylate transporter receptor subunit TctC
MMSLALLASAPTWAQDWPTKPVKIVVPFPPGGSADPIGRAIASKLEASLGQPFIVENKPGASGSIGTAQVARSAPDGYSWVIVFDTHAVNPFLISKMPYEKSDLQPVMVVGLAPLAIATHPDKPYKSLADIVAAAKKNPGGVNFGSVQNGSTGHLQMILWQEAAGVNLIHVPFRGAGPMLTDLMGGHIEFGIGSAAVMTPRVKAGTLRGIAVTSSERASGMPDVATFKEAGFEGMDAYAWWGIYAPAGVPRPILDKFHAETVKALRSPEVKSQLEEQLGMKLVLNKPEEMAKFVDGEMAKWSKIIKEHNIRMD